MRRYKRLRKTNQPTLNSFSKGIPLLGSFFLAIISFLFKISLSYLSIRDYFSYKYYTYSYISTSSFISKVIGSICKRGGRPNNTLKGDSLIGREIV